MHGLSEEGIGKRGEQKRRRESTSSMTAMSSVGYCEVERSCTMKRERKEGKKRKRKKCSVCRAALHSSRIPALKGRPAERKNKKGGEGGLRALSSTSLVV